MSVVYQARSRTETGQLFEKAVTVRKPGSAKPTSHAKKLDPHQGFGLDQDGSKECTLALKMQSVCREEGAHTFDRIKKLDGYTSVR